MNGKTLGASLLILIIVGTGVALLTRVVHKPQELPPAELFALVDGLLDATDPCSAVIESDPDFQQQLRTPAVRDGKLTKAGLAKAWRQSIDLVETGSLAPKIQARIDMRIDRDAVTAGLQRVRDQYETLLAGSSRYSAECRGLLNHFGVPLRAAEVLVETALEPGKHVAWAMDYSLAKITMMNSLETFVDGVMAMSGEQAEVGRQRFLEASAAFMVSPVMDYVASHREH
jgi:hypothetical protein